MAGSAMPAIFFGHGNPMNALETNAYTEGWRAVGRSVPRPRAILAVSAHWYLPGTRVTAGTAPRTIHDFGGFPRALYEVRYDAPGDPALADRVASLVAPTVVASRVPAVAPQVPLVGRHGPAVGLHLLVDPPHGLVAVSRRQAARRGLLGSNL